VRVIPRAGRFTDKRTLAAEGCQVRARRFVVAAGSTPLVPPIEGLEAVPYLTNETVFRLTRRPGHLLVVGGGPIGVEMAQAFRRLGARVTLLAGGGVLPRDDPELAARVRDALLEDGVAILDGARVLKAGRSGRQELRLTVKRGEAFEDVEGTHLLLAAGRAANVEGLGLRAASVAYGRRGIEVNDRMRTTNPRIYAVGDVTGGPFFTHWAGHQAGLAVRSILFRFGGGIDRDHLTWATFTDPELAHVGLSEREARERHGEIRILRWPFAENDRAQTERATVGLVKVIATKKGRIVGAGIVGRQAGELIGLWALAIAQGLSVRALTGLVLPYPTLSETARRVAVEFYRPQLRNPWLRRLIRALRLFG
jgi:pyruvate/2-oxoglutarate dehydrogenase complex dihydrolipoamide dehydrogenase (E3) component